MGGPRVLPSVWRRELFGGVSFGVVRDVLSGGEWRLWCRLMVRLDCLWYPLYVLASCCRVMLTAE